MRHHRWVSTAQTPCARPVFTLLDWIPADPCGVNLSICWTYWGIRICIMLATQQHHLISPGNALVLVDCGAFVLYTMQWNAFLHLASVTAAEKLAMIVGDTDFAVTCKSAVARAQTAIIELLWDSSHSRFRGYVCQSSRGQQSPGADAVENTDNLMADSLYGVLWAELLGLDLGLNRSLFELHQRSSFATANEFGLPFWTNKTRDYACKPLPGNQAHDLFTDDTIWSAHAIDEGALALFLGAIPTKDALKMAQRTVSTQLHTTSMQYQSFKSN